ncbi:MAG: hemerythrin domain-containing protein [Bacteroidia bacterium]
MENPIDLLMQEHQIITKALENVLGLKKLIQADPDKYNAEMRNYIGFFRNYADNFHHQKEERILFIQMKRKKEEMGDGVLKEMYDNHADFRDMLSDIESLIDDGKYEKSFREYEKYYNALLDHIAVEDQEVFQSALAMFTKDELVKLANLFTDTDTDLGMDYKRSMEKMVK